VLQQRGIGLSKLDALTEETLRLDHYLADLEALRRHLQLPRMTILGHSWGGMLELLYASRYPQHVAKLVLLDSGGPTAKFFDYFGDNIRMRLREEDRELMKQAKTGGDHLRAITPGYYYDRDLGVKSRAGFPDEWLVEGLNPIVMKQYGELGDQIVKGLKRYHGPVELIQGRQDPIGESTVYEIKAALPQTKIHFIERTGHLPWTESQESIDTLYKLLEDALK
jgi:proline iminopeptidase